MSAWLDRALLHMREDPVPKLPKSPKLERGSHFGDFGNFGTALSIVESEVKASFEWIVHRLVADHGRALDDTIRSDALTILQARLLNDPRLVPAQTNPYRCLVCDGADAVGNPLVPGLTAVADRHLWLHLEQCHEEQCRRQTEKAKSLMRAAGLIA